LPFHRRFAVIGGLATLKASCLDYRQIRYMIAKLLFFFTSLLASTSTGQEYPLDEMIQDEHRVIGDSTHKGGAENSQSKIAESKFRPSFLRGANGHQFL
jgi:hypothetical protein